MKCTAKVSKDYFRVVKDYHDSICKRQASFKVYGKILCSEHAAMKALKILNSRGEVLEVK